MTALEIPPPPRPPARRPELGRWTWLFAALAVLTAACGAPPPRAPNASRALDERRAVEVIVKAFHAEGDAPEAGRALDLGDGKQLQVDVGARERKYGVAYVTPGEERELGAALPPRTPDMGDALQLVSGVGSDEGARILVLRAGDYKSDDQIGTGHEETTIAAENKLGRDVRDFLVRAHSQRWP
ncbi:MAG: hypothetical protein OZ921_15725 [Sorangiineae bacterium]|nr:hypothetical protein [Polyangiaceae bacterium]MEB2323961.1 hypothetical protein [Sorangiineae bacterium]